MSRPVDYGIYADNAATTKPSEGAVAEYIKYLTEEYANPSSLYRAAGKARKAVNEARQDIASLINCESSSVYFTSGGTESDNWAIKGAARANSDRGMHIIASAIEHKAVLNSLHALEKEGFEVTYLGVDETGLVRPEELKEAIRRDTILVSVMTANNEIGTLEPVAEIGKLCRQVGVLFHTDAVQACGHIELDVRELNVDLLSASAHKFNGCKGTGFLYVREGVRLQNLVDGGGQEANRRSGTENVAGICAMAKAFKESCAILEEESTRLTAMRKRLDSALLSIGGVSITGHPEKRLPGSASYVIDGIEGESLVLLLDMRGISVSSASACSSGAQSPSYVLTATGIAPEKARGSLRISLGRYNREQDIDIIAAEVKDITERLRSLRRIN